MSNQIGSDAHDAHEAILRRFDYHQPTNQATAEAHQRIRRASREMAATLLTFAPASREQSLALTRLQEVMMWANAAIAIHGLPEAGSDGDTD